MKKLKVIRKKDHVTIFFGEWFDKTAGNSYYDSFVRINDMYFEVPYKYGYNAGDNQAITEALEYCGYRLRTCNTDKFAPIRAIHTAKCYKLKRELFK